jgi:hypothetical protein
LIAALLAPFALIAPQAQAYTAEQFATLKFLEGRWTGTAPDGTAFFEQYELGATTLRMRRFGDPSFVTMSDESQITLEDGRIGSRWDDHSWQAVELGDGLVRFEAIDAPNGFSLRRVDANTIEVQQRWRDAKGKPQLHASLLHRLK